VIGLEYLSDSRRTFRVILLHSSFESRRVGNPSLFLVAAFFLVFGIPCYSIVFLVVAYKAFSTNTSSCSCLTFCLGRIDQVLGHIVRLFVFTIFA